MAMMGDGSYGSSGAINGVAWVGHGREKEIGFWEVNIQQVIGFPETSGCIFRDVGFVICIWWKKKRFIIYINIADVENCGSFKNFSYIYIYRLESLGVHFG